NDLLPPLPTGLQVPQNLAMTIVQTPKLLAGPQLQVAIQNRQGRLQVMSRRSQGICGAEKTFSKLCVFLQKLCRRKPGFSGLRVNGIKFRRSCRFGLLGTIRLIRCWTHIKNSWRWRKRGREKHVKLA